MDFQAIQDFQDLTVPFLQREHNRFPHFIVSNWTTINVSFENNCQWGQVLYTIRLNNRDQNLLKFVTQHLLKTLLFNLKVPKAEHYKLKTYVLCDFFNRRTHLLRTAPLHEKTYTTQVWSTLWFSKNWLLADCTTWQSKHGQQQNTKVVF